MSSNERRNVPRKAYAIPVRFNVIAQELAAVGPRGKMGVPRGAAKFLDTIPLPQQGETVNLSERGIRFKTRHSLSVGESVEIFFTLPTELTGRAMEDVKCNARVVHVDREPDMTGHIGVGAAIECFERTSVSRNWDN
ncbi:MAG: PilZ domain-containing protein [Candidatus Acidiferrales bacterium]